MRKLSEFCPEAGSRYERLKLQTRSGASIWTMFCLRATLILAILASVAVPAVGASAATLTGAQSCDGSECPVPSFTAAPRTLSIDSVHAEVQDGYGVIRWSTGYESGNVGFNILARRDGELVKVNETLIPSTGIGIPEPQEYVFSGPFVGDSFYFETLNIDGEYERIGLYSINEPVGTVPVVSASKAGDIAEEVAARQADREALRSKEINLILDEIRGPAPTADEPLKEQSAGVIGQNDIYLPFLSGGREEIGGDLAAAAADVTVVPDVQIKLLVDEDGIYRVTHEDFLAANIDLTGITSAYLALSNQGKPVRMRVVAARAFGPGAFIEFPGEALDTLYTGQNVYVLEIDRTKAFRAYRNLRKPDMDLPAPDHYLEQHVQADNIVYSYLAPIDDPWYMVRLFATGTTPVSQSYDLVGLDNVEHGAAPVSIEAVMYGGIGYDHHVRFRLNGDAVMTEKFEELDITSPSSAVADNVLLNDNNELTVELPADTGDPYDIVNLESVTITYPRRFVARNDELRFDHHAELLEIDGMTNVSASDVIVYSRYRDRLWRIESINVTSSNLGTAIAFPGWGDDASYVVATRDQLKQPEIQPGVAQANLISNGTVDFVILSHPDFISGLAPLVNAREAEGLSVKVVNILDVFAQYSHFVFDANAIRAFLTDAIEQMDVKYVLLAGGDTYDYRDFSDNGSVSFIPSLYRKTHPYVLYGAVDPLYVDSDDDGLPDAAIGRFPVRTTGELNDIVNKTLLVQTADYGQRAIFAADENDNYSYSGLSDGFITAFENVDDWDISRIYLDDYLSDDDPDTTVATANQDLITAFNSGPRFVSYLGHSAPTRWTFLGLLSGSELSSLTNADMPAIVVQWGCWNTYYVSPTSNGMAHQFMLSGNRGAAAVLGSTGLTFVSSDVELSQLLTPKLSTAGVRIGDALTDAKEELSASRYRIDVVLGWTLMGDPTLIMTKQAP